MGTRLEGIATKARRETKFRFTSLAHHVTHGVDMGESMNIHPQAHRPGVDGISVDEAKKYISKMD